MPRITGSVWIEVHDQDDRNCSRGCWAFRTMTSKPSTWQAMQYGLRLIAELPTQSVCILWDQVLEEYPQERLPVVSRCDQCKNAFGCSGQAAIFETTTEEPTNDDVRTSVPAGTGPALVPIRGVSSRFSYSVGRPLDVRVVGSRATRKGQD